MKHIRVISLAVIAMIGIAALGVVAAQDGNTANVEVRVWQSTSDAESLYISARPEGGSWATLGTIPLDMSGLNSRGTYRYGDITVAVEIEGVAQPAPTSTPAPSEDDGPAPPPDPASEPEPFAVNVEIRVWQSTADAENLYISARHEGGRWDTLGTIPLDMSGLNGRGTFRYGDIALAVPVPGVEPQPEAPTPTPTPWVDPRPDNTYTLQQLASLPTPAPPNTPPKPRHIMAFTTPAPHYGDVRVSLISDAVRVTVSLVHTYEGVDYNVSCMGGPDSLFRDYAPCEYTDERPFNRSGTDYLSFSWAWSGSGALVLVAATLDGEAVTCESREGRLYWCFDAETYSAWQEAVARALEPATDPLERYLRKEAGPPLWWQDSPYTGEGPYTTGVFAPQPYVTYTISRVNMPGTSLNGALVCAPFEEREGITYVDTAELASVALWLLGPVLTDRTFYVRAPLLCEFEIENEGEWAFTVSASE